MLTWVTNPNLPSYDFINMSIIKDLHSSKFEILHESELPLDRGLMMYTYLVREKDSGALPTLQTKVNSIAYQPLTLGAIDTSCAPGPSSIEVPCEQGITNILQALIPRLVRTTISNIDVTKIGFNAGGHVSTLWTPYTSQGDVYINPNEFGYYATKS